MAYGAEAVAGAEQGTGAPIDYGPNGIPVLVWPDGIANGPPTAPNLQDVAGLIPGGPGWGF